MPDICTTSASPGGCGHRMVTIGGLTFEMHEGELVPLSSEEREAMFRYAIRHKGVALAQLLNRVVQGDEATNVKIYTFFGPGAAIAKNNIGAAYVNICPGLNGERVAVDLTGCADYRFMLNANVVTAAAGQTGVRVVRDTDVNDVLHEAANIGAAGERDPDTGWLPLPAWALAVGASATPIVYLRAQAKSTVAADDPIFRRLQLGLR